MTIERPAFATTLMRTGYATAEVDATVDRVMDALARPAAGISVDEVEALKFTPVSYRTGYDMEQVDDWLDDVVDELRRRAGQAAPTASAPAAYDAPHPGAVAPVENDSTRLVAIVVMVAVLAVLLYVSFA